MGRASLNQRVAALGRRTDPQRRFVNHALKLCVFDRTKTNIVHQVDESRHFGGVWDSWALDYTEIVPDDFEPHVEELTVHAAGWKIARPLLYGEKQKGLAHCGRGFGKSNLGCTIVTAYGFDHPFDKAKLVSPTYDLAEVNKEKILSELPILPYLNPNVGRKGSEGEEAAKHRLTLINGFRYQFASSERESSLRAGDASLVWLDERQDISQKKRDIVFFQMRKTAQYLELQTGTPIAGSDFEEEKERFEKDPDNCLVYNAESRKNVFIPTKLYDDAAKTMDRKLYEQEVLGLFRALKGAVYWNFSAEPGGNIQPYPMVAAARDITSVLIADRFDGFKAKFIIGVDYPGYAVIIKVIAPDYAWVIDEIVFEDESSPERLIKELKRRGYFPGLVCDDASGEHSQYGVMASKAMRNAGFRVTHAKKNPHVMDRVAAVRAKLENMEGRRSLFIDPRKCRKLRKALVAQIFKNEKPDKTCGYIDDINDALGYAIFRLWRPSRIDVPEQQQAA